MSGLLLGCLLQGGSQGFARLGAGDAVLLVQHVERDPGDAQRACHRLVLGDFCGVGVGGEDRGDLVAVESCFGAQIDMRQGRHKQARERLEVLTKLEPFDHSIRYSLAQALKLLKSEALYRSEKVLGQAQWLYDLHRALPSRRNRDHVLWRAVAAAPAGFCHPRSSMIGTLLEDLAAGMPFDDVSRRFAEKMHPLLYQRPQAAPSAGNIAQAEKIVAAFAFVLRRTLGVGGPLGVGAAVHIFVGMVEAPLIVRPYLTTMSRGELFALMSCGMAGIAGTVMAIYGAILGAHVPDALPNIITASIISTPAALALAALMVPFRPDERTTQIELADPPANSFEAIVRGTMDGVKILAGIIALLIVLVALVHLVDAALSLLPEVGGAPVSLRGAFALIFRPLVWLIGAPWPESATAAHLMATKTVLNEFVAYLDLSHLPDGALSPRTKLIMTYALCGFANVASLGIMMGGLTAMAPDRRDVIIELAPRSMLLGEPAFSNDLMTWNADVTRLPELTETGRIALGRQLRDTAANAGYFFPDSPQLLQNVGGTVVSHAICVARLRAALAPFTWASSTRRAAGVMPSRRLAWAIVEGFAAVNFCFTSVDRLNTAA